MHAGQNIFPQRLVREIGSPKHLLFYPFLSHIRLTYSGYILVLSNIGLSRILDPWVDTSRCKKAKIFTLFLVKHQNRQCLGDHISSTNHSRMLLLLLGLA